MATKKKQAPKKAKTTLLPPVVATDLVPNKIEDQTPAKGRPTDYTPELGDLICSMLAEGISLKRVCEKAEMPSRQTIYTWLRIHETFLDNYMRAKDDSADAYADDIADIADRVMDRDPQRRIDPHAARVAIEGKKWAASKLKPKKYGDKLDLTGETTINHRFKEMDDDQLDAAIRARAKNTIT
jgi:hypothetical protein